MKNNIIIKTGMFLILLLIISSFVSGKTKVPDTSINDFRGNIDFVEGNFNIEISDVIIEKDLIAVDSSKYNFTKEKTDIFENHCTEYTTLENETVICSKNESVKVKEKIKLATLSFNGCKENSFYEIIKHSDFTNDKEKIKREGSFYTWAQCINNKVSFEIDSFSSYTLEEIDSLKANLVYYFNMEKDSGMGNYTGSFTMTDFGTEDTTGIAGQGRHFTRSQSDYINTTLTKFFTNGNDGTVSLWAKTDSTADMNIYSEHLSTGASTNIRSSSLTNLNTRMLGGNEPQYTTARSNGIWYNYVLVKNGTQHMLYINGNYVMNGTIGAIESTSITLGNTFYLGAFYNKFDGSMDEIYMYDRAMSPAEINTLYNISFDGYSVFDYPTSEGAINTSYLAIPVEIPDFTIGSSSYSLAHSFAFNTTLTETNLGVVSSFNFNKLIGTGDSDVYMNITIDNVSIYEGKIRTVSKNKEGVSSPPPLSSFVANGEHILNIYTYKTGIGTVEAYNIDFSLGRFKSTEGNLGRVNITTVATTFNNSSPQTIFSKNINRTVNTSTFLANTFSFSSNNATTVICNFKNGGSSPFSIVSLPGGGVSRTTSSSYVTEPEDLNDIINISCLSSTGANVSINGSFLEVDMEDNSENTINHAFFSNASTNYSSYVDVTAGHSDFLYDEFTMYNGTGLFISSSVSIVSISGDQTPTFHINVTDSNNNSLLCYYEKERQTTTDVGNAYFYPICPNLQVDHNYTITLGVVVETGETLRIYDEALSLFEVSTFDISLKNTQPTIFFEKPSASELISGNYTANWTYIDFQDDISTMNLTLSNYTYSFNIFENISSNFLNYTFNSANFSDGYYNLTIYSCENETDEKYCSNDRVSIRLLQTQQFICGESSSSLFGDIIPYFAEVGESSLVSFYQTDENGTLINDSLNTIYVSFDNSTFYETIFNNGNSRYEINVSSGAEEDAILYVFTSSTLYVCVNDSIEIKFRTPFYVTLRVYNFDNQSKDVAQYINDFNYIYLKYEEQNLNYSNYIPTNSEINSFFSGMYSWIPGADVFFGSNFETDLVHWGRYENGQATIKLYEEGIYSINLLTQAQKGLNWSYEFYKPQQYKIAMDSKIAEVNLSEKRAYTLDILTNDWEIDKIGLIINWFKITMIIIFAFISLLFVAVLPGGTKILGALPLTIYIILKLAGLL